MPTLLLFLPLALLLWALWATLKQCKRDSETDARNPWEDET